MSSEISFYVPVMPTMARDVVIGNLSRLGSVKDVRFVEKQIPGDHHCIDCFVDYHHLYSNFATIPQLLKNGQGVQIELLSFIVDTRFPQIRQYLHLYPNTGRKVVPGERKECIQIVEPVKKKPVTDSVPKSNKYFSDLMKTPVAVAVEFTEQDCYNMDEIDAYLTRELDEQMWKELEMEQDLEDFWDDIDGVNAFLEEQQISNYIASLVV